MVWSMFLQLQSCKSIHRSMFRKLQSCESMVWSIVAQLQSFLNQLGRMFVMGGSIFPRATCAEALQKALS